MAAVSASFKVHAMTKVPEQDILAIGASVEIRSGKLKLNGEVDRVDGSTVQIRDLRLPPSRRLPERLAPFFRKVRDLSQGGQAHPMVVLCIEANANWQAVNAGEEYVLKLLRPDADETARLRFLREIESLQAVSHPNVVKVLAASDSQDPEPWLLLPKGESFKEFWRALRESATPEQLFDAAWQVWVALLGGLQELHKRDWVHRDIKEGNVVQIGGVPVLIDLGLLYRPEDEENRLSMAEGWAVGNHLTRIAPADYNRTEIAKPWFDSLGMTNLLAYMLAADPRDALGHYHWRYHRFVEDERCEVVRLLMALTADESTAPKDADSLRVCCEQYLPNGRFKLSGKKDDLTIRKNAIDAAAQAKLRVELQRQERLDLARRTALVAARFLSKVSGLVQSKMAALAAAGISVEDYSGQDRSESRMSAVLEGCATEGSYGSHSVIDARWRNQIGRQASVLLSVSFEALEEREKNWGIPFRVKLRTPISSLPDFATRPGAANPIPPRRPDITGRFRNDERILVANRSLTADEFFVTFIEPVIEDEGFLGETGVS